MHTSICAALASFGLLGLVNAHGYVATIVADGVAYPGATPTWMFDNPKPQTPGWFAYNQDNGFVPPDQYTNASAIPCHKGGTPGTTEVTVTAGSTITLHWNTWPDSHWGPVIDYLAPCSGSCTGATGSALKFTKIDALGLVNDASPPGLWADNYIANNATFAYDTTIPAALAPGYYVLRHEIIALHSAQSVGGAQNYPMCINLKVTGSGADSIPAGTPGIDLYTETDPGIVIDIYQHLDSYPMPGPALWSPGSSGTSPSGGSSPSSTSVASSTSAVKTTTAVKPSSTFTTSASAPTTSSGGGSGGTVPQWGQCGGISYTGPTTCAAGFTCHEQNPYYSQCI